MTVQTNPEVETRIERLITQLTLEEKAGLCSGQDAWTTKPVERLGIPSIWLSDGPHGLRKLSDSTILGIGGALPATCYPTASALACSWDRDLLRRIGAAIGQEAQAQEVQIVLGPGVNMKRSPLGGRNFEYFSEDPLLAGELGAAFINGMQDQGVGTSLKHYACNSQESGRMYVSSEVDERTLREIYLTAFEIAVKKAQPWTVMASYNKVNGVFASEHPALLHDILKREWGFTGVVVSDWGAVNDRVAGVRAGLHLEFPFSGGQTDRDIVHAVQSGELDARRLDAIVREVLRLVLTADGSRRPGASFDADAHHALVREAGADCMVLLKNAGRILPLNRPRVRRIALIGRFAKEPRYQGSGSSKVQPTRLDNVYDELAALTAGKARLSYAEGYQTGGGTTPELLRKAKSAARRADVAVVFVGLPPRFESEGLDRTSIALPSGHDALVEAVASAQKNTVVVLVNGSAVSFAWAGRVKAILEAWLTGQAAGGAIADVLMGRVNPSGKLAETFPVRLQDTAAYGNFPGEFGAVRYGEGVFIGYRHHDARGIEPLYPFGHGLSYTTFDYGPLRLDKDRIGDDESLSVSCEVTNTGRISGKEIVQLYVRDVESSVVRPPKELRAFAKVTLQPGERTTVNFELGPRDFAYYDPSVADWVVESGDFEVLVGASSRDIRGRATVTVERKRPHPVHFTRMTPLRVWMSHPVGRAAIGPVLPPMGLPGQAEAVEADHEDRAMMEAHFSDLPAARLVAFSQGKFTLEMLDGAIAQANAHA